MFLNTKFRLLTYRSGSRRRRAQPIARSSYSYSVTLPDPPVRLVAQFNQNHRVNYWVATLGQPVWKITGILIAFFHQWLIRLHFPTWASLLSTLGGLSETLVSKISLSKKKFLSVPPIGLLIRRPVKIWQRCSKPSFRILGANIPIS